MNDHAASKGDPDGPQHAIAQVKGVAALWDLDRVLLGRQAERVPAHRVQHVVAAHAPGARHDVGGGVPLGMTDMQTDAGRVGKHVEDVALGPAAPARGAERPMLVAVVLPAGLDLAVVVGHVLLYPVSAVPVFCQNVVRAAGKRFGLR